MTRVGLLFAVAVLAGVSRAGAVERAPRSRPPEFSAEEHAVFFDDAFTTLVGEPPAARGAAPRVDAPPPAPGAGDGPAWRNLIAADTLETEIKRQAQRLAGATRSASAYKAGGFRDAADALGLLATLFAITDSHTDEPRWRDTASGLRDLMAAAEADASTDAAYRTAAARSADLSDLIRGGRPATPEPAAAVDWAELAGRSTLMRRMEAAEADRLRGWVGDERSFRRNAEGVRHEAQVLAALAEAAVRPEAYDFDDPDYQAFAAALRDAAVRLSAAAEAEDQPAAAAAMTAVSRSCVDCHADYRG